MNLIAKLASLFSPSTEIGHIDIVKNQRCPFCRKRKEVIVLIPNKGHEEFKMKGCKDCLQTFLDNAPHNELRTFVKILLDKSREV